MINREEKTTLSQQGMSSESVCLWRPCSGLVSGLLPAPLSAGAGQEPGQGGQTGQGGARMLLEGVGVQCRRYKKIQAGRTRR